MSFIIEKYNNDILIMKFSNGEPVLRSEGFCQRGLDNLIQNLPNDIVMAEIGCAGGGSTYQFITSGKIKKMYCIDSWVTGYSNEDWLSKFNMEEVEYIFDYNLSNYIKENKIIKIKNKSEDAVKLFEDKYFDFIYIDANHEHPFIDNDIINWLPKVKHGGFFGGHDYVPSWKDVVEAVNKLLIKPDYLFENGNWLKKIS